MRHQQNFLQFPGVSEQSSIRCVLPGHELNADSGNPPIEMNLLNQV